MNIRYDVFNAERLKGAEFTGIYQFPMLKGIKIDHIPETAIGLDKVNRKTAGDILFHHYVEDFRYGRIYERADKYLDLYRRVSLVAGLDHSVYRDTPLAEQIHSLYLNRASDYWLQREGVRLVPNVSCGDEATYKFCCDGLEHGTSIAMSSYGNKHRELDLTYFIEGFRVIAQKLSPYSVVFHGRIPKEVQSIADYYGITLLHVPTRFDTAFQRKAA